MKIFRVILFVICGIVVCPQLAQANEIATLSGKLMDLKTKFNNLKPALKPEALETKASAKKAPAKEEKEAEKRKAEDIERGKKEGKAAGEKHGKDLKIQNKQYETGTTEYTKAYQEAYDPEFENGRKQALEEEKKQAEAEGTAAGAQHGADLTIKDKQHKKTGREEYNRLHNDAYDTEFKKARDKALAEEKKQAEAEGAAAGAKHGADLTIKDKQHKKTGREEYNRLHNDAYDTEFKKARDKALADEKAQAEAEGAAAGAKHGADLGIKDKQHKKTGREEYNRLHNDAYDTEFKKARDKALADEKEAADKKKADEDKKGPAKPKMPSTMPGVKVPPLPSGPPPKIPTKAPIAVSSGKFPDPVDVKTAARAGLLTAIGVATKGDLDAWLPKLIAALTGFHNNETSEKDAAFGDFLARLKKVLKDKGFGVKDLKEITKLEPFHGGIAPKEWAKV